jgi:hypothetical protein
MIHRAKAHPCAFLFCCIVPILLWFAYLQKYSPARIFIYMKIDDYIPFIPLFVFPYLSWFIYMAIPLTYFFIHSKPDFIKAGRFIVSGMAVCMLCYSLFPYGNPLRPEIDGHTLPLKLIKLLYAIDPPNNCLPSIHVLNSIGIHAAIAHSPLFAAKIAVKCLSGGLMALIASSTLFIKQHTLLDAALAVLLGMILYIVFFKTRKAPAPVPVSEEKPAETQASAHF